MSSFSLLTLLKLKSKLGTLLYVLTRWMNYAYLVQRPEL